MPHDNPAKGIAPGLPKSTFIKPRSAYDDDITFSINILMDRIRGLAATIETLGDFHTELGTPVKNVADQIYFIADSARHFADEGDLLAEFAAEELNRKAKA